MEIERKFLPKRLPNLSNTERTKYERYYLFINDKIEIRIQKKAKSFELEYKVLKSNLSRENLQVKLTKKEFDKLKKDCKEKIIRESFKISRKPNITIKKYLGGFKGLYRIEVEFKSEKEAKKFKPLNWFGKEITNTSLGKDSKLIRLSDSQFKNLLKELGKT
ncbi:MAG: hypothetical protein Q7S21_00465 [archaeon]|nr:hypothetical protein [archaeon]